MRNDIKNNKENQSKNVFLYCSSENFPTTIQKEHVWTMSDNLNKDLYTNLIN